MAARCGGRDGREGEEGGGGGRGGGREERMEEGTGDIWVSLPSLY